MVADKAEFIAKRELVLIHVDGRKSRVYVAVGAPYQPATTPGYESCAGCFLLLDKDPNSAIEVIGTDPINALDVATQSVRTFLQKLVTDGNQLRTIAGLPFDPLASPFPDHAGLTGRPGGFVEGDFRPDPQQELDRAQLRLSAAKTEYERWVGMGDVALWLVDTDIAAAKALASDVLLEAAKYPNDWNYGNAIHKSNLALGRASLFEGQVDEAVAYLHACSNVPSSPQLESFGPNMLLAMELLIAGYKEAVLKYLEDCKALWRMDAGRLEEWRSAVLRGVVPKFSANLVY